MATSRSRILSVAFIISMAVNVIIGGFVATQWLIAVLTENLREAPHSIGMPPWISSPKNSD